MARPELLLVADAVAREKMIDREEIVLAMEQGIQKAAGARYGAEKDIRASVDRRNGDVQLSRWTEIVRAAAEPEVPMADGRCFDGARMIPLAVARRIKPDASVGEYLVDPLPPMEFGRLGAQAAKQAIGQRVREVERRNEISAWKDRVGEIVNGVVARLEFDNVIVTLGRTEAMLGRKEIIGRESFRPGDRVRAYVTKVSEQLRGPQVFLSRTDVGFLVKLFAAEVPEIYDGVIEIRAVARDPGSRAKMAVLSRDPSIDAVGACIGRMGSRVRPVTEELQGERIDIVHWSPQIATFVVNAIAPAEVTKVIIDEDAGRIQLVVPDEQLSLAIGRRGQNVRLAAQMTRWKIDLMTEAEESEKRRDDTAKRSALFVQALDVDEMMAMLLVEEGFETVEEIVANGEEQLSCIREIGENAGELVRRAEEFLNRHAISMEARRVELGVADEVAAFQELSLEALVALGEKGILTLDNLADLSADDLRALVAFGPNAISSLDELEKMDGAGIAAVLSASDLDAETANAVVMEARRHWFEDGAA